MYILSARAAASHLLFFSWHFNTISLLMTDFLKNTKDLSAGEGLTQSWVSADPVYIGEISIKVTLVKFSVPFNCTCYIYCGGQVLYDQHRPCVADQTVNHETQLQPYQTDSDSVCCTGDAGFLPVLHSQSDSQHGSARLNAGLHASFSLFLLLVSLHSLCFYCVLLSSRCCRHSVFLPILSPISSPHI